ncbi:hypothetical protein WDU94_014772 [Cyamophila willieti]
MFSIYTSVNLYTITSTLLIISPDSPVVTCVISMRNIPGSNHADPYFFFFFLTSESHFISTLRLSNMYFFYYYFFN